MRYHTCRERHSDVRADARFQHLNQPELDRGDYCTLVTELRASVRLESERRPSSMNQSYRSRRFMPGAPGQWLATAPSAELSAGRRGLLDLLNWFSTNRYMLNP